MQEIPETTVTAHDITGIASTPSTPPNAELNVKVMRSMTFIHVGDRHYSIDRADWDKIRAMSPPTD